MVTRAGRSRFRIAECSYKGRQKQRRVFFVCSVRSFSVMPAPGSISLWTEFAGSNWFGGLKRSSTFFPGRLMYTNVARLDFRHRDILLKLTPRRDISKGTRTLPT